MLTGRTLNDRYKIQEAIGGGGMANVYLARDLILERDVAIKVLRLEYANDEEFIARFHREAQSATSLSHPNIVNIYDVGEEDGIYFMAMEYVDGMTLKKYIQTYGPVDVEESIDIMKQLTSAMAHAHANEIVHRDIKPQNILIDQYGQVKVTDFGIAVALTATSLTQTNSVLGSVHYLSPEQARGGMATKKSDVYSLGIVFFELLTGRLPFSGQTAVSIALKHLQTETPSIRRWLPDVPQSVENIVLKSTSKDPFLRYDNVYDMEADLETALDPDRLDEPKFSPPIDAGEETKAIPIIRDEDFRHQSKQDTLIHDTKNGKPNKKAQEETGKNGRKKKRKKAIIWVSSILVILLGAIVAALFILPTLLQPDDVKIPDVAGKEYEEALRELNEKNLQVTREEINSDEVPEGYVVKTDPKAGMQVKEGSKVTVFTSQGQEKVEFEDYVGRDSSQIENLLTQLGFKEVIFYEKFSEEPAGQIITQIQPQPGTEVIPEDTNVIFEISKGPELVTLQSLEGMTEEEATSYLSNQDLSVEVSEENHDSVPEGNVIRQSPSAGQDVEKQSIVEIVISKGPKELPPVNHTVSVTVPYTGANGNGNGNGNGQKQEVRIYVGDMNNDITQLYNQQTISKNTDFKIKLTIPPNGSAQYKVMRDDDVVIDKTVSYEDVEG
ncbi:Stk1 family PASTA domain-containing Ser/Thr kinase [Radiobacillus kanasensis]|uniref:Stk1 family PASTA domain-containing Ser/Thr kinase n=1 Tax=Radiobacillus kanasensis TaxID=2844358 RepID=UPI001E5F9CFD|nr:Stk1 family PASTA domain-containing Ser/Thr kinase [Radiobacillus kanasensis]UFU00983.1 Stk1 family PASTA domain-containing Ser/Thr kinase [Radiobacillus kanasensis]